VLGPFAYESLTTSMLTSNARIRRELGWAPEVASIRTGIPAMVREWRLSA
jgi:nucleoside-diphosphate-sugar epimerase